MKAKDVYLKTMKFVWLKLALHAAIFCVAVLLLFLFLWIGRAGDGSGIIISLTIWLILVGSIYGLVQRYVGYMLKAGHVAMVTTLVTTGTLPENQFEAAKNMVKERFLTANVYFVVDRLVSGAVSQLQKGMEKVGSLLDSIPGISSIMSFVQLFIHIALNYIDECCLGYTFLHREQSAFQSAADGVVIYFQNWKKLLKDAAVTALIVMVITFLTGLVPFVIFCGIFAALGVHWVFALLLAVMVAVGIRSSFVDSYMMVKMMVSYMETAPSTQITFDLYEKLCRLSVKFKSLFEKGQQEQRQHQNPQM